MRNFYFFGLIVLLILLLFSSCSTTLYTSNTINAPLLQKKGEVKLNADANNFQTAIALGEHIGIMSNGFYKALNANNYYTHRGSLLEAGLGFFNSPRKHLTYEIYLGAGQGNIYKRQTLLASDQSTVIACFNVNAAKFFIQPNIAYTGKYFDIAFTPRLSTVKYSHFISYNYSTEKLRENYLDDIESHHFFFAEPAVTIRGGLPFLKLQFQAGNSIKMNRAPLKYAAWFASIGLVADIR